MQDAGSDTVYNQCFFFGPTGDFGEQGKLHMTRFESEEWKISRAAIAICYDVEFPEIARAAARQGANILIVGDPTLRFQLSQGFEVFDLVGGYLKNDPESLGWAALIEWINEDAAQPEDSANRDPRFPRSPSPRN